MDVFAIAASGLLAGEKRLAAVASNVANQQTTGRLPTTGNPSTTAYQPVDAVQVSGAQGEVSVTYRPASPAYTALYDPTSPDANANGLVAAPAEDPAAQAVQQHEILNAYRSNAAVIHAADDMQKTLLSALA